MNLIDLESDKDYVLDGKYAVKAGGDYLPVSKEIKTLLNVLREQEQALKKVKTVTIETLKEQEHE